MDLLMTKEQRKQFETLIKTEYPEELRWILDYGQRRSYWAYMRTLATIGLTLGAVKVIPALQQLVS